MTAVEMLEEMCRGWEHEHFHAFGREYLTKDCHLCQVRAVIAKLKAEPLPEQEECAYCHHYYAKPVSLHHSDDECARNQEPAPGDGEALFEVRYVEVENWPDPKHEQYVIFICGIPCLTGTSNTRVEGLAGQIKAALSQAKGVRDGKA